MSTLILAAGDPFWNIPGGGSIVQLYGTNGVDSLEISQGARVTFDGSFNKGSDNIHLQEISTDFTVFNNGPAVTLTSSQGTVIKVPAGGKGQQLSFSDVTLELIIEEGGVWLGDQVITSTQTALSASPKVNYTLVSIDQGTTATSVTLDAAGDGFKFTDDVSVVGNVEINNFTSDDVIEISGGSGDQYSFTSTGRDVSITFNNSGTLNSITLTDAVDSTSMVYDEASFESAIGFDAVIYADSDSGGYTTVSIDQGTLDSPVILDAGGGGFKFIDDASVMGNVEINNFTSDDVLEVSGTPGDYTFVNNGEDVFITFNNSGTVNAIILTGVSDSNTLIYDEASFEAAIGFDAFVYA